VNKKTVAKNYVLNLIYQILTILTPLISTPYVARVLGVENNGIYAYTISIITYFILFGSLGTNMYGQREIAYMQDEKKQQTKFFYEILLLKCCSYLIVALTFVLLFCLNGDYLLYYRILIIELLANLIDISWFFQGNEDFDKTVIKNCIFKMIGLVLIFILVKNENDLWKYFLIYTLSDFLGNLSMWFYLPKYLTKGKLKINIKKHVVPIITLFLPQVAIQIYSVLDKTMIGKMTGDMMAVSYYDQAQKIIKALLLIVTAMSSVMCSRISNSYAKGDNASIKKYLAQSFNMVWLFACPIVFGVIAIAPEFVPIYYGNDYSQVINYLSLLSILVITIGLNNATGVQYLISVNKQKEFTISVVAAAIVNVVLNIVFINLIGAIGAVISSIIAETIVLLIQLYYSKNAVRLNTIVKMSIKYFLASLVMFAIIKIMMLKMEFNIINLAIQVIVGVFVYYFSILAMKDKFAIDLTNQIILFVKRKLKID